MHRQNYARLGILLSCIAASHLFAQSVKPTANAVTQPVPMVPGKFVDVTDKVGVHFLHQAPHTSRKYLIETMGSGVALFDCDNDGRLDLFLVNGAPSSDPTPKGFIPKKTGPNDWNRM